MGFNEIYLIGMDHEFKIAVRSNGSLMLNNNIFNHFDKKYIDTKATTVQLIDWINAAYESAEKYSRENGFRIFNATRGGKLEIFERVDFDKLF